MFYSDELVDRVREANDIVDVVGTYVNLKRSGSGYVGLCPFHSEKTGSFRVNRNMQIFKCFGCGKAGNVFTFVMEHENLNFTEAMRELADRAGIELPEVSQDPEYRAKKAHRDRIFEVNKEAAKYYFYMLRSPEGKHALDYLHNRALSDDTIKRFGLGFAGIYSDGLYKYLKSKGYNDNELKDSGMFNFSERGVTDKFWNRVMFPIMDKYGKVIAFGGRIMGKAENAPKYLNSPETEIFFKGENLFGYSVAKHTHRSYILLCEGYMDAIALHQAGFDNAVASLGTALTPKQAKLLSKLTSDVIITYDSDGAGRSAALRALPILKGAGVNAKVVDMTPYKDPDEFISNLGAEAYEQRINEALDGFFFEAKVMSKDADLKDPAEKTRFDHTLAKKLALIEDEIERTNYINAAAEQYNISPQQLTRLVDKLGKEAYAESIAKETLERESRQRKELTKPSDGPLKSQQLLVSFVANNRRCYEMVRGKLDSKDLSDPLCASLLMMIFNLYEAGTPIVHAKIISNFEAASDQEKVAQILDASLYEENIGENERAEAFAELVVRVLSDNIDILWQQAVENNDGACIMKLMERRKDLALLPKSLLSKN